MTDIAPGWYPDPVDRTIQRYWDGEVWIGDPLPVDATPGDGPPPVSAPAGHAGTAQVPAAVAAAAPPGQQQQRAAPPVPGQPGPVPPWPGQPGPGQPGPVPPWPGQPGTVPPGPGAGGAYRYPFTAVPRPHGYPLAPVFSRLVARIIDILALLALNIAVNWWLYYQFWLEVRPYLTDVVRRAAANQPAPDPEQVSNRANWLLISILLLTVALWFAYEVPAMANTGQTPGKRVMHIKVVRMESPEPLGFRRAWRRWNTLGLPTLLWSFFFVGFLLQFVNCLFVLLDRPLHQALHDRSAATVVVAAGPGSGPSDGGAHAPTDPR